MNPEDRSVDEIDAAMERRWAKVTIEPDPNKLRDFLTDNGMSNAQVGAIIQYFNEVQGYLKVGHALFRAVNDAKSFERLWRTQLSHIVLKRFRFDDEFRAAIEALTQNCLDNLNAQQAQNENGSGDDAAAQ